MCRICFSWINSWDHLTCVSNAQWHHVDVINQGDTCVRLGCHTGVVNGLISPVTVCLALSLFSLSLCLRETTAVLEAVSCVWVFLVQTAVGTETLNLNQLIFFFTIFFCLLAFIGDFFSTADTLHHHHHLHQGESFVLKTHSELLGLTNERTVKVKVFF